MMRQAAFFSDNNYQDYEFTRLNTYEKKEMSEEFPIIGSNNNYWIKWASIIGNYRSKKNKPLAATPKRESPSAMDYKKQISIIRIILSTNYNYRN